MLYSATFSAISVSAAQDVFEVVAGSGNRVAIREIVLGQYSDFGDAEDELLSVQVIRGYTTSGSGGASVTPRPFNSYDRDATTTVERNNTTQASSGTAHTLIADSFNVRAGWYWGVRNYVNMPNVSEYGIILKPEERAVVAVTVPADALTMNGTIVFEELAKAPVS